MSCRMFTVANVMHCSKFAHLQEKTLIDSVAFSTQPLIFQRKFGPVAVAVTASVCEIRIAICLQYVVRQVIDVYIRICIVRS